MSYTNDRRFGDLYIKNAINGLIRRGFQSVDCACDELDMKQSADLIGTRGHEEITIAFRVRDNSYYQKYKNQFTLRYRRSNGAMTEYAKIISGHGDWMLYCFVNDSHIEKYVLFNLDGIRERAKQIDNMDSREIWNKGKTTSFIYFMWKELPENCFIDSNYLSLKDFMPMANFNWLDEYIENLQ